MKRIAAAVRRLFGPLSSLFGANHTIEPSVDADANRNAQATAEKPSQNQNDAITANNDGASSHTAVLQPHVGPSTPLAHHKEVDVDLLKEQQRHRSLEDAEAKNRRRQQQMQQRRAAKALRREDEADLRAAPGVPMRYVTSPLRRSGWGRMRS